MHPFTTISTLPFPLPKKVLDIGTGTGWAVKEFVHEGCNVTAIDPQKLISGGLKFHINFKRKSLEEFKSLVGYDLIIANSISHLVTYNTKDFIKRLIEFLSPGGLIYVTLLGDEDEWATDCNVHTTSYAEVLKIIDNLGLEIVFRSIEWHNSKTISGSIKSWNIYTFVLHQRE